MSRTFTEQVALNHKQRERRAKRISEYEKDKAVIEDDGKQQDEKTSPKNKRRSSKPAE